MKNNDPLSLNNTKNRYNNIKEIWPDSDLWHKYTHSCIEKFINDASKNYLKNRKSILNLGSGGNNHCFNENNVMHVDIAEDKIKACKNYLVSDIQKININNRKFDVILCVGSVVNYCDPSLVIKEAKRLCNKNGIFILEFESSRSFEFLFSKYYAQSATVVSSFYQNEEEKIWVYSESYINNILKENNFNILNKTYFHILTPLIYFFTKKSNFSSKFSKVDNIAKHIPFIRKYACNIILLASSV
ncbi:methyltransferase domain-containing protein [Akkermansia sp. 54_46]|uniref:class I SAM-dependent methyltransferase n=1 Tax=Akkermansia sp. 54_46 TaxID=1896967 RepID=UPI00257F69D5|nr:methyltransferase domain-containing protein [Akkermansia sp. 54_46]